MRASKSSSNINSVGSPSGVGSELPPMSESVYMQERPAYCQGCGVQVARDDHFRTDAFPTCQDCP